MLLNSKSLMLICYTAQRLFLISCELYMNFGKRGDKSHRG